MTAKLVFCKKIKNGYWGKKKKEWEQNGDGNKIENKHYHY